MSWRRDWKSPSTCRGKGKGKALQHVVEKGLEKLFNMSWKRVWKSSSHRRKWFGKAQHVVEKRLEKLFNMSWKRDWKSSTCRGKGIGKARQHVVEKGLEKLLNMSWKRDWKSSSTCRGNGFGKNSSTCRGKGIGKALQHVMEKCINTLHTHIQLHIHAREKKSLRVWPRKRLRLLSQQKKRDLKTVQRRI